MSVLRPWLPVVIVAVIALLGMLLVTRTGRVSTDLPPVLHPVQVRPAGIADLGAEVSAPLFASSRRIVAAGASPATPPVPPPQLTGVVVGSGKAVALVKSASGGDTLMLHAGEAIDGWTIVGIAARQIVVVKDGAQQTVTLAFGATTKAEGGPLQPASSRTASPAFDGLAAARQLGLPASNIPSGSPLAPTR